MDFKGFNFNEKCFGAWLKINPLSFHHQVPDQVLPRYL